MSAPAKNQEENKPASEWTKRNFMLDIASLAGNGWGLPQGQLAAMIPYLHLEDSYDYDDQSTGKNFSFEHLQLLARYLHEQQVFETSIREGIRVFLDRQSANKSRNSIDDDTNYDRAIQEVLVKILSPGSPIRLVTDGQWGRQTQASYDQVVRDYHLQPQSPSRILLEQLELIAARIIRLRCDDSTLAKVIERNPFCVIDETANLYELESAGLDAYIRTIISKDRLVHLRELLTEQSRPALQEFAAFSPWFMLLKLESKNPPQLYGDISLYLNRIRGWVPIGEMLEPETTNGHVISPNHILEISLDETNRQGDILFKPKQDAVDIICCVFSEDFRLLFFTAPTRQGELGLEIPLNLREFFNYPSISYPRVGSAVLKEGNFLKLFVVSRTFKNGLQQGISKPGELPAGLYALITASEEELLGTVTVGLKFESATSPDTKPRNFKDMVASLYSEQPITVPDDLQKRRWGGLSTNKGKTLKASVTNKLPGYYNITITLTVNKNETLAVDEVAFFLHDSFKDEIQYEPVIKGKAQIKVTAYEAFTVGAYTSDGTMLELDLNEEDGYPNGFYYKEVGSHFKEEVEKLYRTKTISVEDDIQKNRWGGKPIAKGKILSAEVNNSFLPGNYKVTLKITSENSSSPLKGDVAFFLHDSFSKPIRYKKARDGEAKITVTAYEDFTAGAYTEDGTQLELDLNKVKGFPKGFYYKDKNRDGESGTMQSKA